MLFIQFTTCSFTSVEIVSLAFGDIWNGMGFLLSGGTNTAAVTATERDEVQQGGRGGACRKKGEESYGIEQDSKGSYGAISFKRERCESGDPIL